MLLLRELLRGLLGPCFVTPACLGDHPTRPSRHTLLLLRLLLLLRELLGPCSVTPACLRDHLMCPSRHALLLLLLLGLLGPRLVRQMRDHLTR